MSSTTTGAAAQQAESNYNRTTNSKLIINDLNYDSSSSSTSSSPTHQYDDEQQQYSQSQYQQTKQPFQTNYNQTGENNISNMMMLMNYNQNSSFNNSITNSSGLGDSMSLPCMSADNSSIYNNQNGQYMTGSMPATPSSPNKNDESCSSSASTSPPPSHHSKINPNAPIFKQLQQSKNQEMINKLSSLNLNNTASVQQFQKMLSSNEQNGNKNNYFTNGSNPDYDPFNDYVGMEKMLMQMTNSNVDPTTAYLIKNKMASLNLSNMDPQQQQLITQAIASVVASEQQQQQQVGKPMNTSSRSMSENIEMLNSKYLLNQKNNVSNNSNNQNEQIIQSNMNSLLATVANSDSYMTGYNSPNMPMNMKRLSFPQAATNQLSPAASPHHQSTSSPFNNNRLSSNHNLFGSVNLNDQTNRNGNQSGHQDKISNSNSAFNLSLNGNNATNNNTIETNTNNAFHANNSTSSANNSSCYDDDDVFTNTSSSSTNQSGFNPQQLTAANIDPATLSQLYRNFLSNPGNGSNISDLFSNYNANLAALSLNPDIQNFNKNGSLNNASNGNAQLSQQLVAAAVYKQRQSMLNNRLSNVLASNTNSTSGSSNIAALTSATSNIAALLNTNGAQQQQSQQFLGNNDSKRRINSQSSFNTQTANNSGQSFNNALSSGLFSGSHSMGPNATHLLQNSSLASSARLNSSTSSSAAASVLGNNSTLSHALNSLSHHQANLSLQNQNNSHLLNGGSLNSSINGVNQSLLNFNSSPSSNQGILSALSLSSTAGSSLAGTLLSSSGKPLRSERLPSNLVDEIIKQAKVRRRNGGKKEVCVFCRNNGEKEQIYTSHTLKDASNHVACPILRLYQCPICHASGDQAHTIKYCPYAEKDSNCIKLFKENGRMTAAAALLMNSMSNSPPPLSPPATPPPQSAAHLNYLQQQQQYHSSFNHPNDISSPNATAYTLAQLASLNNLSQNSFSLSNTPNQNNNNNNKSAFLNSASLNNTAIANAAANSMLNSNGNSSLLSSNFSNSANLKQINN